MHNVLDFYCILDMVQYFTVNGVNSMECKALSDVTQGSVLSPLLFLVYINDITDLPITKETVLKLFANDILVYKPIHTDV